MVEFSCNNGEHKVFQEVYYIPKFESNIISLGKMIEEGNEVHMVGETMKVFGRRKKLLMMVKQTQNFLNKITLRTSKPVYLLGSDLEWL